MKEIYVAYLNDIKLNNIYDLEGKILVHKNKTIGNLLVNKVIEENRILESTVSIVGSKKIFQLNPDFYINLKILKVPSLIDPLINDDVQKNFDNFSYYQNESINLEFLDYYVPFGHNTREQVSLLCRHNIADFSDSIYNFRYNTGFQFSLSTLLFNKNMNEIEQLVKESKQVVLIDLLGIFNKETVFDNENLVFIDAKRLNRGHLIQKLTDVSIRQKSENEAKIILENKYQLNENLSDRLDYDFDYCYIFDDVYTNGYTTNRIRELINQHNGFIEPIFKIVTLAKTVKYQTNEFRDLDFDNNNKDNILFVCHQNMTRSILAEAIAKKEFVNLNQKYNFYSAGIQPYAGRMVSDGVYRYIIDNNLYHEKLKPKRLLNSLYDSVVIDTIKNQEWTIINLENDLQYKLTNEFGFEPDKVITRHLLDVCNYDNKLNEHYGDIEYLANEIRKIILEVL